VKASLKSIVNSIRMLMCYRILNILLPLIPKTREGNVLIIGIVETLRVMMEIKE